MSKPVSQKASESERPLLMCGEMVRATLSDTKTQTRRLVKGAYGRCYYKPEMDACSTPLEAIKNPYGKPGTRLWVRENFAPSTNVNRSEDWPGCPHLDIADVPPEITSKLKYGFDAIVYQATVQKEWEWCDDDGFTSEKSHWRPSIHMPRWASRLTLEITAVRVERLQDISEADAWAEGCKRGEPTDNGGFFPAEEPDPSGIGDRGWDCAKDWYADLWDSLHGPGAWDKNPWVWAVTFKRLTKQ